MSTSVDPALDVASCSCSPPLQFISQMCLGAHSLVIATSNPAAAGLADNLVGARSRPSVWTCCECGLLGTIAEYRICPDCGHELCSNCSIYRPKSKAVPNTTRTMIENHWNWRFSVADIDTSKPYSDHFEHFAFVWPSTFGDRRTRHYQLDDKIAIKQEIFFDTSVPLTTQVILERSLDYGCDGDRDRYLYLNEQIKSFLQGLDFGSLCQSSILAVGSPLILLWECNSLSATATALPENRRPLSQPLNAHELYIELCRGRFPVATTQEIVADRRLIYIPDTDPYCTLALLATASALQLPFLRNFIYKNLAFQSFIGVKIPSIGFKTFALEFHLPYFAWRRTDRRLTGQTPSRSIRKSHRKRRSQKVRYLNNAQENEKEAFLSERIYEAQVSLLVTGIDDCFWTSYCFADIYFKDPKYDESAEYYHREEHDPHSGGKDAAIQTLPDAREYYLRKLACRMEQVKEEWKNLISQLLKQIEPHADKIFAERATFTNNTKRDLTQEKSYRWTIRVLRKFTNHLSSTIARWETFKEGEIRYFFIPKSHSLARENFGQHLAAINMQVEELVVLRSSLQHQTEVFEKMTNSLATQAAVAENRTLIRQSHFIQALTVITIFYLPLNLASAIYSMQPSILPNSIRVNDYVYTLVGLTFATLLLVINLQHIVTLSKSPRGGQDLLWKSIMAGLEMLWIKCKSLSGRAKESPDSSDGNVLEMDDRVESNPSQTLEV